ncbi:hypothetical protein [Oryza sativa Japonica Group]|uniref:Uncharacterized protein n=1 Tax=Oryza sativa subsp. japonica TaxID=39947 RepID=Q657L0_ORYSJ|nr:hypothetical protein [Oryza sativa Japonica Group]
MPCHQGWKESPRTVPNHSSNSRQDRFSQKNRSGRSKVKKVKKVWVRKEAKTLEVVTIKEESQDVQVPTGDAAKTIQAEKTEADAVAVDIGGLTKTDVDSLTETVGRSDRGALEKSGKIESNTGASTSTKNIKNHCLAPRKQPQPKWIPSGLSRSQKRRLQCLRAIGQKEKEAEDVKDKACEDLESRTAIEVNLSSLRYFEQDDLLIEDYKTLMGGNIEDVIDKRLKTLKEMKTLQDGVFREQLMGNT